MQAKPNKALKPEAVGALHRVSAGTRHGETYRRPIIAFRSQRLYHESGSGLQGVPVAPHDNGGSLA